ncbi:MAG: hypothetical protein HKN37_01370 [Rhodothermales bacterium]|nr:hypothetical protein [Rhodothermales bacterium]
MGVSYAAGRLRRIPQRTVSGPALVTARRTVFTLPVLALALSSALGQPLAAGPRVAGLGGAATAVSVDRHALGNPASPATTQGVGLALSSSRSFGLSELDHVSAALALATKIGSAAAVVESFGFEQFRRQTMHVVVTPVTFFQSLTVGARISYTRLVIRDFGSAGYARAALGLRIRLSPTATVGMAIHNLMRSRDDAADAIRRIEFGSRLLISDDLAVNAVISKDAGFNPSAHLACEYVLLGPLVLRAAIATGPSAVSFGIGVRHGIVEAGVASRRHQQLGWSRSVGFAIGR